MDKVTITINVDGNANRETKELSGSFASLKKGIGGAVSVAGGLFIFDTINSIFGRLNDTIHTFTTGSYEAFEQYEQGLIGVMRTTGATRKEVDGLGSALRKLETPTDLSELQDIMRIGGAIGIATDELLGFTTAIDKVNVALGDEFAGGAEEIARNLGSIKNIFADVKGLKAEDAFNRIGSAINSLGAAGNATGPNIADFAQRMGRVQSITKLTTPQVLGLGAALEEVGIQSEIGSGGLTQIFIAAGRNTDIFAKKLGMTEKAFKDLFNTNPIGFIEKLSQKVAKLPQDQAIKFLEELKIGSQESAGVLLSLGSNAELVGKSVKLASESFQEATSITDEFNASAESAAAQQAIFEKQVESLQISIGEMFAGVLSGLGIFDSLGNAINEVEKFFEGFAAGVSERSPEILESWNKLWEKINELGVALGLIGPEAETSFDNGFTAGEKFAGVVVKILDKASGLIDYLITNKEEIKAGFAQAKETADTFLTVIKDIAIEMAKVIGFFATLNSKGQKYKKLMEEGGVLSYTPLGILNFARALEGGKDGGYIRGYQTGGFVSGPRIGSGRDNILVRAEADEVILNKRQQGNIMRQLDNAKEYVFNNYFQSYVDPQMVATTLAFQMEYGI